MGVSGAVGLVDKNLGWPEQIQLLNRPVILDTTNDLFWYIKLKLLARTNIDKYGCSMPDVGKSIRNLLTHLRERKCVTHVVFEGPRKSERHGPMVSKVDHLKQSANGALNRLSRGNFSDMDTLPDLAINCLKEIVNEMNLPPDQVHQAEGEVYPTLVHLSKLHNAPVLTPHSDFIFQDVPAGFIWLEKLQLPNNYTEPINCVLLSHRQLLQRFSLDGSHSEALGCLCVLLRDDFAEIYYDAINECLDLQRAGSLRLNQNVRRARVKTKRLVHVLANWPRDLTSRDSVRRKLQQASRQGRILQDFDAIWQCYFDYQRFDVSELADTIRRGRLLSIEQVNEALTRRESSVNFLANAMLTNFNRTGIEDLTTFRSTFSLRDRVKQFLLNKFDSSSVRLFDRQRYSMRFRSLSPLDSSGSQLSSASLYEMFQFDDAKLALISTHLREKNQIDAIICNELALLLLLASHVIKLVPLENYNNQLGDPKVRREDNLVLPGAATEQRYTRRETKLKFLIAILNSYVFLQLNTNQGDQSLQSVPCNIRVARQKVVEIDSQRPAGSPSLSDENYMTHKHLIEGLNSVLHAYKELNSLYDYQGQKLPVNKYYDGVIIYKIMARDSNNLRGSLLGFDEDTLNELI